MATRAAALPADERRAAIIAATLPLLCERGASISTREIAAAAGIAEGTIFSVFPDKRAVIAAAIEAALDTAPTERELAAIDRKQALDSQLIEAVRIMQNRTNNIWRLLSSIGESNAPRTPPADLLGLADIFREGRSQLRLDPVDAARQLRAITLAVSNPALFVGKPLTPNEIVTLFLDGARVADAGRSRGRGT